MKLTILGFLTISCQIEIDNSLHAYNLGLPSTVCRNGSYGIFKKKTTTKSGQKDNGAEELRRLLVVSSALLGTLAMQQNNQEFNDQQSQEENHWLALQTA